MINSIQWWLKQTLDGLVSPQLQPLQAVIQPPVDVQAATNPICYIWAGDGQLKRVSAPRPKGWQKWTWQVDLAILAGLDIDDPNQESAFPLLLDQITATLSQVAMPFVLTDPVTGFGTQVLSVGETSTVKYARVRTPSASGSGLVKFGADFTLRIEEDISFLSGYP